jgi:hypothetical protein
MIVQRKLELVTGANSFLGSVRCCVLFARSPGGEVPSRTGVLTFLETSECFRPDLDHCLDSLALILLLILWAVPVL